jgi:hypothetical protein
LEIETSLATTPGTDVSASPIEKYHVLAVPESDGLQDDDLQYAFAMKDALDILETRLRINLSRQSKKHMCSRRVHE